MTFAPTDFLDLSQTDHALLFQNSMQVWDALKQIGYYLQQGLEPKIEGTTVGTPFIGDRVAIGAGTVIEHGAVLMGPARVGKNCRIRSGCYFRGNVIVGDGVTLGNSCEFKNCVIFNEAEIPHFNYVGDSIVGYKAHLAAGVILSNVRLDRGEVSVKYEGGKVHTGLRKFGSIIGDRVEIGCNTVLSPGSIIGRNSMIYPLTHFGGVLPANTVLQNHQNVRTVSKELLKG